MDLDLNEFDPDNPDDQIKPGKFHVLIQEANEDYGPKSGTLKLEVLAGTVDGCVGKTSLEFVAKSAASSKHRAALFIASGLTSLTELREMKKNGVTPRFNFNDLVGRQVVCQIVKPADRDFPQVKFGCWWAVDDPAVADVPKNGGMLAARPGSTTASAATLDGTDF